MSKLSRLLKKVGNIFPGTGRHAARRAERQANEFTRQAQAENVALARKTERERARAQRLAIRGLRSRRAASYFSAPGSPSYGTPDAGRATIG